MRLSTVLSGSILLASALAAPAAENHHAHVKRGVVYETVHEKTTVVVGPAAPVQTVDRAAPVSSIAPPPVSPSTVIPTASIVSKVYSPVAVSVTPTTIAPPPKEEKEKSEKKEEKAPAQPQAPVSAAGVKGITYSPYNADGTCRSEAQVATDLAALKDYGTIRLYGVDCNQVVNVLKAKSSSQKLFLGIFFVDDIVGGVNAIKSAIESYGSWNDITTVSIGNELVNGGQATPAQVGQYIAQGRSALQAAGYNGPVVSVDTFIAVINNPELCQYSDYMAINAHAFFDQNTLPKDAGKWLLQQIQRVWTACDGKKNVVVSESGWPSQGQAYGKAIPSKENQKQAVDSITSVCGDATILFTAFNDYWKGDGFLGVEKYWGVLSSN